jgi:hypothetical protein
VTCDGENLVGDQGDLFYLGQSERRAIEYTATAGEPSSPAASRLGRKDVRKTIAMLLICLFADRALAFAEERPINPPTILHLQSGHQTPLGGSVAAVAIREVNRRAALDVWPAQPGVTQKRSAGHPVLIGAAIGAGVGAVAGYVGTSCSVPPPNDHFACGSHYKGGAAILGAGVGAALGAVIGLAIRH